MKHISHIHRILIVPVVALATFLPINAEKANAQIFVPVFDSIHTSVSSAHASFQDVAKMSLDTLAYTVAQLALDQLTQSTVTWIKSGFAGNPAFAIDPNKLFLDTANVVAGGLSNQIRGIETCNFDPNFNNDLANMVALSTRSGATARFNNQIKCPFPSLNVNASTFYNDFENGGWRAYEAALSDRGNPFGVSLLTNQELIARQTETQRIKEQQLGWAGGFLSMETCGSTDPYTGVPTDCRTTTPGVLIQDQLSQSIGTDMNRLGFADNLNKVFSALIGQLTQNAMNGIF